MLLVTPYNNPNDPTQPPLFNPYHPASFEKTVTNFISPRLALDKRLPTLLRLQFHALRSAMTFRSADTSRNILGLAVDSTLISTTLLQRLW